MSPFHVDDGAPCGICRTTHMAEAFDVCQLASGGSLEDVTGFKFDGQQFSVANVDDAMTLKEWQDENGYNPVNRTYA